MVKQIKLFAPNNTEMERRVSVHTYGGGKNTRIRVIKNYRKLITMFTLMKKFSHKSTINDAMYMNQIETSGQMAFDREK